MQDDSYEASVAELQSFSGENMSPTTNKLIDLMLGDHDQLKSMGKGSREYVKKTAEIMRSEIFLQEVFAKDHKFNVLATQHEAALESRKILALGDYHRLNFNYLKTSTREYLAKKNKGLTKKFQEENPLNLKSCKDISDILKKEAEALANWNVASKSNAIKGKPAPKRPERPMTKLISQVLPTMPGWTMLQVRFEVEEYQLRNDQAHTNIEEYIEEAQKDKDAKSDKWATVAQCILNDQKLISEGDGPKHLLNKQSEIMNTLTLFQNRIFSSMENTEDPDTGMLEPISWTLSDKYMPKVAAKGLSDPEIEKRIRGSNPTDAKGKELKELFLELAAEETVAKSKLDVTKAKFREAEKVRDDDLKAHLKARSTKEGITALWLKYEDDMEDMEEDMVGA
jgi:hypothetical protein